MADAWDSAAGQTHFVADNFSPPHDLPDEPRTIDDRAFELLGSAEVVINNLLADPQTPSRGAGGIPWIPAF